MDRSALTAGAALLVGLTLSAAVFGGVGGAPANAQEPAEQEPAAQEPAEQEPAEQEPAEQDAAETSSEDAAPELGAGPTAPSAPAGADAPLNLDTPLSGPNTDPLAPPQLGPGQERGPELGGEPNGRPVIATDPDSYPPSGPENGTVAGVGRCLDAETARRALSAALVSVAPSPICAANYQIVALRNLSDAPLVDVRLLIAPPLGPDRMRFTPLPAPEGAPPHFFEISTDDGVTWAPLPPPLGEGVPENPMVWSQDESRALARLEPLGRPNDSVLVRWRAELGDAFGSDIAGAASLWIGATASDGCGRVAVAPLDPTTLSLQRPELLVRLDGRNVTRGGAFSTTPTAAPGDEVEWRVTVDNVGPALALNPRVLISGPGGAIEGLRRPAGGGADPADGAGVVGLAPVLNEGRQSVRVIERVGPTCGRRATRVLPSFGCAARPPGELSALGPRFGNAPAATLITAPDPDGVTVTAAIEDAASGDRPGERARVRLTLVADTAPIFEPALEIALPDGYEIDAAAPPRLVGLGDRPTQIVVDATRPEAPVLRLIGTGGAPAALSDGDRATITLEIRRRRAGRREEDRLAVRLRYRDGCGEPAETALVETPARPRQAAFALTADPIGDGVLFAAGDVQAFRLSVENVGEETARRVEIRLRAAPGWRPTPPEGCFAAEPGAASAEPNSGARLYVCPLAGALAPGARDELVVAFTADRSAVTANAGLGLAVSAAALPEDAAAADANGVDGGDAALEGSLRPLGESLAPPVETTTGAVGFSLRQRVLSASGATRRLDSPVELGERLVIEVEARWFGVGDAAVETPAVTLTLPPALGFRRLRSPVGSVAVSGRLLPTVGEPGRVLWSLEPFERGGRFVGRVEVEAIGPTPVDAGAPAPNESEGALTASALFSMRARAYGVDPAVASGLAAEPVALRFRRPDLRFTLEIEGQEPDAEGRLVVAAGEQVRAFVRVENAGAGPGFLDWARFHPPAFIEIAPFDGDGLDNDGDGRVDEPGEGGGVFRAGDDGGVELRWIAPPGGAADRARQLLSPGETARWPFLMSARAEARPGAAAVAELDAQFAATPFVDGDAGLRARAQGPRVLAVADASGFAQLARTSVGGDLNDVVVAGERLEMRISVAFPPGVLEAAALEIDAPPAFADARIVGYRFGPAVSCAPAAQPERVALEDGSTRLVWALGDCAAQPGADAGSRRGFVDLEMTARDAEPFLGREAQAAWRAPALTAALTHGSDAARRRAPLGRVGLSISGPLLSVRVTAADGENAAPPDPAVATTPAGGAFVRRIDIENLGDVAAEAVRVALIVEPIAAEAGSHAGGEACAAAGLSGLEIAIETLDGASDPAADGASIADWRAVAAPLETPCGVAVTLEQRAPVGGGAENGAEQEAAGLARLPPGARVTLRVSGRVAETAPMGAVLAAPVRVTARSRLDPTRRTHQPDAALRFRVTPAPPPAVSAVVQGHAPATTTDGPPLAAIEDVRRFTVRAPLSPGAAEAVELSLRLRLESPNGAAIASDGPAVRLLGAALSSETDGLAWLGPASAALPPLATAPVDIAGAVVVSRDPDGWTRLRLPLGAIVAPSEGGALIFEVVVAVADTPAASEGRLLTAAAEARLSADLSSASAAAPVARIGEPFMDLAVLTDDADGAVQAGERVRFTALACNRGAAPAYGLRMIGRLPDGFLLDETEPMTFFYEDRQSVLAPRRYGDVTVVDGVVTATASGPGADIAPGACVAVRVGARAPLRGPLWASGRQVRAVFDIDRYQGRPSLARPGRRYRGRGSVSTELRLQEILVSAPERIEIAPGGRVDYPFSLSAPSYREPLRLSLSLAPAERMGWRIHVDLDGDGVAGPNDPIWTNGGVLAPGQSLSFVARAEAPLDAGAGWSDSVLLRAVGATDAGRRLGGARELVVRRAVSRTGDLRAERLMAVDRDCDGELADETIQDAAFEPVKFAAPGECVVMRIEFRNFSASPVERVTIEDPMAPGTLFVAGTPRFIRTPSGLVGGGVVPPTGAEGRVQFRFVGALAPGQDGAVEYRVRLSDNLLDR